MSTVQRVSLIVVTYRSRDVVADCLRSAQAAAAHAAVELEVILIDNSPGDGSIEAALTVAPDARVISNEDNVGFGRACNQGFEVATGQWWLLLNPDAELEETALATLVGFAASHSNAGAVAPSLTGAGTDRAESAGMQPSLRSAIGHFLFVNRLLPGDRGGAWRGVQVQRRPGLGPRQVEWASGGALLLRPAAVREVDGFDPSFFLYAEDIDLGRRLRDAGWEAWLVTLASARHAVAASQGGVTNRWYTALHDEYARRAGPPSVILFDLIAGVGLGMRALLAGGDGLHRRRMSVAARAAIASAGRSARSLGRG